MDGIVNVQYKAVFYSWVLIYIEFHEVDRESAYHQSFYSLETELPDISVCPKA